MFSSSVSPISNDSYAELFRHLRIASRLSNAHYWRYDFPGPKLTWSENACTELNAINARQQTSDLSVQLLNSLHPEDAEQVRNLLANPQGDGACFEFRRINDDGSIRYLRAQFKCFRNDNGELTHLIGATADISNEVLLKKQLQQQTGEVTALNERLESISQSSKEGHWVADFASGKHWCSDVYRELLGYGPEHDFTTMETYQAIAHPDELEGQYHMVMALKDGETYERTIRLKHADGGWRWMQVRGSLQRDANGQPMRLTGNIRSVHEQTVMQKQLDEYQQRFARAIHGTHDGLWELNLSTHEVWMSPRCADIFGYTALEVVQWNENNIVTMTHPEDLGMMRKALHEARYHGKLYDLECRMQTKNGLWIWVNVRGTTSFDEAGQASSISGSLQDVTTAHHAREKLIRATADAEAANRAKSIFLANMSHELRTPMNGIIGMSQLLAGTPLNDMQREFADIINSSAQGLLAIINDVLDISKIEASKLRIEHIELNLRDTVDEVVAMMATQIASKNLELIVEVQPDLPTMIKGDPHRIRQCLLNLLSNAYKFTQQGHILVTVTSKIVGHASALELSVTDTGIGIDADAAARLFQPFVQADSSTTRKFGGTGLGLSIVKGLVELMGGNISVHSEPGKGSRFWFTLPLKIVNIVAETHAQHAERLLIIDDNALQCAALAAQLRFNGYKVDTATDIHQALALLRTACTSPSMYYSALFVDEQLQGLKSQLLNQQSLLELHLQNTRCIMLASISHRNETDRSALNTRTLCKPIRYRELQKCLQSLNGPLTAETAFSAAISFAADQKNISSMENRTRSLPGEVLLIEDNIVNQKVAMRFLQRMGAKVTVANNGAKGVELFKRGNFALILMDIQMPVMDGYQATRSIRELQSGKHNVPIVALTANTMPEDRERCLAAGMDDFLTKPLQIDRLTSLVNQHCSTSPANESMLTESQADQLFEGSTVPDVKIESQVNLDKLHAVIGDDTLFLAELVDAYVQTAGETIAEMKNALDSNDNTAIARAAHKLKGASSNMCIVSVSEQASLLETQIHTLAAMDIKTLISNLNTHVESAVAELTNAVQQHKPAA